MIKRQGNKRTTRRWVRNESDERAMSAGCWFDESRAEHVCQFIESYCCLYEGHMAGQLVRLMDWQVDTLSRVFGWVRWSEHWGYAVRRFKKASLWIPKKNGKSPTAAMVGLYLLIGDGEMGQKVFSAAKDGKQAQIVHMHARQMIRMSDVLTAETKINESTGRITHLPTQSWYDVIAGDNIKGQEGLNGSVVIDEAHVVDERLARRLEYMGISRSEPMQFVVSTAGTDTDGWGKKLQDYGRSVTEGTIEDLETFCQIYEAPQQATDAECSSSALWQAANPSWGHTINAEEFEASATRAQTSLTDWMDFKMYRLNIWSHGASPFLRMDDWQACEASYDADDLEGELAFMGLDLSQTKDMTAAVLLFPRDGQVLQLPFFWMPEEEARRKNHLASYLAWGQMGVLRLTPGDVVDYRIVEDDIAELCRRFSVRELAYDKTYAENITQRLYDRCGVERVVFPQTMMALTGPTSEYERRVINGTLRHPKHPVLSWQASHVEVKSDTSGNRRPVKPDHNNHKKIDGIVAAIMALGRIMIYESEGESIYSDRGMFQL